MDIEEILQAILFLIAVAVFIFWFLVGINSR